MKMLFTVTLVSILLLIWTYLKSRDSMNLKEIIADSLILISTTFGTVGGLNIFLTNGLSVDESFIIYNIFLIIVSIISASFVYIFYFNKDGLTGLLWFLSEIFMAFGLTFMILGLLYLNTGNNFIPKEILIKNFPSFFNKNSNINEKSLEDFKMAGTLMILNLGFVFIIIALIVNKYKITRKSIKVK